MSLGALTVGLVVVGAPGVGAVFATTPPTAPCAVTPGPHDAGGGLPVLSSTNVLGVGVVQVRGSLKDAHQNGTQLEVVGCSPSTPLANRSFILLAAPKSDRYLAVLTYVSSRDAAGHVSGTNIDFVHPSTERAFDDDIKDAPYTLKLPGLKGTVSIADVGTPLELLASKADNVPITAASKVRLADAYIGTGGYDPPVTPPCAITGAQYSPLPKLRSTTRSSHVDGRVELRGTLTPKSARAGGEISVFGCTITPTVFGTTTHTGARSYLLLRAPHSARYLAVMTTSAGMPTLGNVVLRSADFAPFTTERAFDSAVKKAKRRLTIPGLKGPVYTQESGTPLELLATTSGGHAGTPRGKEKLATTYLITGGFTTLPPGQV